MIHPRLSNGYWIGLALILVSLFVQGTTGWVLYTAGGILCIVTLAAWLIRWNKAKIARDKYLEELRNR